MRAAGAMGAMLIAAGVCVGAEEPPTPKPVKMSLAQARQSVALLNDVYVNGVVLTHGTYFKDRGSVAAATVARQVFAAMAKKGWPETRWLGTTGRPLNPENNPRDAFERDAIAALKKGRERFERVEDGKLRVATLVPLLEPSCQTCHTQDNVGAPIGGLSYTVHLAEKAKPRPRQGERPTDR